MNVLSSAVLLLAVAVGLLVPILMASAYLKNKKKKTLTCPETGKPATVEVDAKLAAATAVFGEPTLRLKNCSRWPARKDCGQECLRQIEVDPDELLEEWTVGKSCAVCGKPIGTTRFQGHYPALMDASGRTQAWDAFPQEKVPEALATHQPVCWNCHLAQIKKRELAAWPADN